MSAPGKRTAPATVIGQVTVLAPTGACAYYRLTWTNPDGTAGRTTGGKNLAAAITKATPLAGQLERAAGGRAMTPLSEILAVYLSTGVGRHGKIRFSGPPLDTV